MSGFSHSAFMRGYPRELSFPQRLVEKATSAHSSATGAKVCIGDGYGVDLCQGQFHPKKKGPLVPTSRRPRVPQRFGSAGKRLWDDDVGRVRVYFGRTAEGRDTDPCVPGHRQDRRTRSGSAKRTADGARTGSVTDDPPVDRGCSVPAQSARSAPRQARVTRHGRADRSEARSRLSRPQSHLEGGEAPGGPMTRRRGTEAVSGSIESLASRLPARFWHPTPTVEDGQMTGLERYLADLYSWLRQQLSLPDAGAPRSRGAGAPQTFEVMDVLGIPAKRMVLGRPE